MSPNENREQAILRHKRSIRIESVFIQSLILRIQFLVDHASKRPVLKRRVSLSPAHTWRSRSCKLSATRTPRAGSSDMVQRSQVLAQRVGPAAALESMVSQVALACSRRLGLVQTFWIFIGIFVQLFEMSCLLPCGALPGVMQLA